MSFHSLRTHVQQNGSVADLSRSWVPHVTSHAEGWLCDHRDRFATTTSTSRQAFRGMVIVQTSEIICTLQEFAPGSLVLDLL